MAEVMGMAEYSRMTKEDWKIPPPSNPLLIDLVLDKLVTILNIKDLPGCRLVCKLWNLKILPRFRTEFEVCVHNGRYRDGQNQSLWRYLIIMETRMDVPHTKFRLNLWTTSTTYSYKYDFSCKWGSGHLILENWTVVQHPYWGEGGHIISAEDSDEMIHLLTSFKELCARTTLVLRSVDSWRVEDQTTTTELPSNAHFQMSEIRWPSFQLECKQWRELFQKIECTGSKHW